jgi:small conductance mechanosensitive channel
MISTAKIEFYLSQATDWLIRFLPNFISAVLILIIGWWVIGKIDKSIKVAMNKKNFEASLTTFLRTLFSIGSKTILVIMVAGQIGFQTTSLAAIIGAVGLAVGLALQGSLANLAGGVLILLFKPYKVGDVISVNGFTGKVKEIQIFNTVLVLEDNQTAILPNGSVSNGPIINRNKQAFLIVELKFMIPLGSDQEKALQQLSDSLRSDSRIMNRDEIKFIIHQLTEKQVHYIASLNCKPDHYEDVSETSQFNLLSFYKNSGILSAT